MDTLIKDFMSGQMSIVDFEKEFKVNSHLRDEINKLIPAEAKSNPNHPMWADKPGSNSSRYNQLFFDGDVWTGVDGKSLGTASDTIFFVIYN